MILLLIADTQKAYSVAQRNRMEAEANLLLFENPKDPGATTALDAIVADILYKDGGLGSLKEHTNMRRSELIGAISGLDTKHPGYAQIKRQLQDVEKEVQEATEKLNKDVRHMLIEERRSKVTLTKKIEKDLPGFPIVLHGASSVLTEYVKMINNNGGQLKDAVGIPVEQLRRAARSAVCKINIDSDGRLVMTGMIRKIFAENPSEFDPRKYLGPARDELKKMIMHKNKDVLGSAGQA